MVAGQRRSHTQLHDSLLRFFQFQQTAAICCEGGAGLRIEFHGALQMRQRFCLPALFQQQVARQVVCKPIVRVQLQFFFESGERLFCFTCGLMRFAQLEP